MNFRILLTSVFILLCGTMFAQSLRSQLTNEIDRQLRTDSPSWKASQYDSGTVTIQKSRKSSGEEIILEGEFYVYITRIFKGRKKIKFTARAEMVLDEATVNCLYWTQPYLGSVYTIGDCN